VWKVEIWKQEVRVDYIFGVDWLIILELIINIVKVCNLSVY